MTLFEWIERKILENGLSNDNENRSCGMKKKVLLEGIIKTIKDIMKVMIVGMNDVFRRWSVEWKGKKCESRQCDGNAIGPYLCAVQRVREVPSRRHKQVSVLGDLPCGLQHKLDPVSIPSFSLKLIKNAVPCIPSIILMQVNLNFYYLLMNNYKIIKYNTFSLKYLQM